LTADGKPRRARIRGSWLDLRGNEVLKKFFEVWTRHLATPVVEIASPKSHFDTPAWQAGKGAAFFTTWKWVGGTPGDACEYEFRIRFEDGTLIVIWTVDSCWMDGIDLDLYEPVGRRDDLVREFRTVLAGVAERRADGQRRRADP